MARSRPETGVGAARGGALPLQPLILSPEQRGLVLELFGVADQVLHPPLQDLDPLVLHTQTVRVGLVKPALQLLHLPAVTQSHSRNHTQSHSYTVTQSQPHTHTYHVYMYVHTHISKWGVTVCIEWSMQYNSELGVSPQKHTESYSQNLHTACKQQNSSSIYQMYVCTVRVCSSMIHLLRDPTTNTIL